MMAISLEQTGFIVENATSWEEAEALIEKNSPDLIVLDYKLPDVNGADACARIRSSDNDGIRETPIIMLTAYSAEEIECLNSGANDFVTKPVSSAVLEAHIQTQLRLRNYARELEEWRRVQTADLKLARSTQQALIPSSLPQINGWEVQARYRPLIEVGGDVYGWEPLEEGRWAFWMADGTGHGVAAALTTALTAHLFIKASEFHNSPAEILAYVNRDFTNRTSRQTFMTACCIVLSPDGCLRICNAGHPPVLVRRNNGQVESYCTNQTILGIGKQFEVPDMTVQLEPGDMAVLYTNGLYAMNSKYDERFTYKIVEKTLMLPPDQCVLPQLIDRIAAQSDGTPPDDDLSVIILMRKETQGSHSDKI